MSKNNMNSTDARLYKVIMTGVMMALIMVSTAVIKIPFSFTGGYKHLGDAMIFLGVLLLGRNYGALAAGLGSSLADLIGGHAHWAPWTFVIKAIMAFIVGIALEHAEKKGRIGDGKIHFAELLAMILGGIEMTAGYYVASGLMRGDWYTPLLDVPGNIVQFVLGIVVAVLLATTLYKTPAKKLFEIK